MAWVMIAQLNGTDNYIQMGTRNCAIGCGFNCCATNGATEIFMERNNGNILGKREVDLGYPSTGQHKFNITYYTPSNGGQSKFIMSMDDVTKYIEMDDGWRDWSLSGASFELITETWNQSDQNGGAPGNSLFMQKAKRGLNQNPLVSVSFTGACMDGDDNGPHTVASP